MDKGKLPHHLFPMTPKAPRFQPNSSRIVEVLAYPSVKLLDVTGPIQVFASANAFMAQAGRAMPYAIRIVARGGDRVEATGGVELAVHPLSPTDAGLDTLVIAGGEGVAAATTDTVLIDWVRERAKRARRTASVCTGAFLLAASGMLDGRRAVTHWAFCAELARRFPTVRVEPDPIFVRDGTVWTSAGVTAGIDLALARADRAFRSMYAPMWRERQASCPTASGQHVSHRHPRDRDLPAVRERCGARPPRCRRWSRHR